MCVRLKGRKTTSTDIIREEQVGGSAGKRGGRSPLGRGSRRSEVVSLGTGQPEDPDGREGRRSGQRIWHVTKA